MSGGIAYVLDEEGDFERRCNLAMVELEPVPSENHVMERQRHQAGDLESHGLVDITDMSRFDEERLYQLIENHLHYTGSSRAKLILDNWAEYLPKFVKVMPVEYRRALEEMAKAQVADKSGLARSRSACAAATANNLQAKELRMPWRMGPGGSLAARRRGALDASGQTVTTRWAGICLALGQRA